MMYIHIGKGVWLLCSNTTSRFVYFEWLPCRWRVRGRQVAGDRGRRCTRRQSGNVPYLISVLSCRGSGEMM